MPISGRLSEVPEYDEGLVTSSRVERVKYNLASIDQGRYWKNLYWFILADNRLTLYALLGAGIGFAGGYNPWVWLLFIPYTLFWSMICFKFGFVEKVIEPSLYRKPMKGPR